MTSITPVMRSHTHQRCVAYRADSASGYPALQLLPTLWWVKCMMKLKNHYTEFTGVSFFQETQAHIYIVSVQSSLSLDLAPKH